MSHTNRLRRRRPRFSAVHVVAAMTLLALSLRASSIAADTTPSLHQPRAIHLPSAELTAVSDASTSLQKGATGQLGQRLVAPAQQNAPDSLGRRKHVTFQDLDQLQGSPDLERSRPQAPNLDRLNLKSSATLESENVLAYELESAVHDTDPDAHVPSLPDAQLFPVSDPREYKARHTTGRARVAYNQDLVGKDLVGKQTGNGYVFSRHAGADLSISDAGAALVNLFTRRDSPVSRPPLVPNSNSRLLIGLVIVCIIAVGIITIAVEEIWRRQQAGVQPRSPLRRSGDGRSARTLHRNDGSYSSLHTSALTIPSLEEEEERIKTPPTLSRRSSAAATTSSTLYSLNGGSESDDDEVERKSPNDLHYLSLPFGIGIGYSYANIADGGDARTRISRLAAKRSRSRYGSTLALSTGALPIAGTSGVSSADGLRSRSRSFKELCRDAFSTTTSRDISMISEEEDEAEMSMASTPRWGSSLVSLDLTSSERGSGTVTPTGPSSAGMPSSSASSIALEDLTCHGASAQSAKGRYFGVESGAADCSHTLIDLGLGTPELAVSDPDGITRPASTPGVMPSQIARHPQVEQLRREGRSETGKRVGKGTPTNAKLH